MNYSSKHCLNCRLMYQLRSKSKLKRIIIIKSYDMRLYNYYMSRNSKFYYLTIHYRISIISGVHLSILFNFQGFNIKFQK